MNATASLASWSIATEASCSFSKASRSPLTDYSIASPRDTRHRQVIRLYEKHISQREFPEWTMGFTEFPNDDSLRYLEGFSEVLERDFDLSRLNE